MVLPRIPHMHAYNRNHLIGNVPPPFTWLSHPLFPCLWVARDEPQMPFAQRVHHPFEKSCTGTAKNTRGLPFAPLAFSSKGS